MLIQLIHFSNFMFRKFPYISKSSLFSFKNKLSFQQNIFKNLTFFYRKETNENKLSNLPRNYSLVYNLVNSIFLFLCYHQSVIPHLNQTLQLKKSPSILKAQIISSNVTTLQKCSLYQMGLSLPPTEGRPSVSSLLFLTLPTTQGKDIVFRFIIEYSSLRDFGPWVIPFSFFGILFCYNLVYFYMRIFER